MHDKFRGNSAGSYRDISIKTSNVSLSGVLVKRSEGHKKKDLLVWKKNRREKQHITVCHMKLHTCL